MEENPMGNRCKIVFECWDTEQDRCVYKRGKKYDCYHLKFPIICKSSVAKVNAMVMEMKRMGVEFDGIKSTEIKDKNK